MSTCTRCRTVFDSWREYHTHMITNTCFKKIVPHNTSGRTKQQIVEEWEYVHSKHLVY